MHSVMKSVLRSLILVATTGQILGCSAVKSEFLYRSYAAWPTERSELPLLARSYKAAYAKGYVDFGQIWVDGSMEEALRQAARRGAEAVFLCHRKYSTPVNRVDVDYVFNIVTVTPDYQTDDLWAATLFVHDPPRARQTALDRAFSVRNWRQFGLSDEPWNDELDFYEWYRVGDIAALIREGADPSQAKGIISRYIEHNDSDYGSILKGSYRKGDWIGWYSAHLDWEILSLLVACGAEPGPLHKTAASNIQKMKDWYGVDPAAVAKRKPIDWRDRHRLEHFFRTGSMTPEDFVAFSQELQRIADSGRSQARCAKLLQRPCTCATCEYRRIGCKNPPCPPQPYDELKSFPLR